MAKVKIARNYLSRVTNEVTPLVSDHEWKYFVENMEVRFKPECVDDIVDGEYRYIIVHLKDGYGPYGATGLHAYACDRNLCPVIIH